VGLFLAVPYWKKNYFPGRKKTAGKEKTNAGN